MASRALKHDRSRLRHKARGAWSLSSDEADLACTPCVTRVPPAASDSRVILWSIDREGVLTSGHGEELRRLCSTPAFPIGRSISEVFPTIPELIALAHQAMAGAAATTIVPANGVVYEVRVEPLRTPAADIGGAVFAASAVGRSPSGDQGLAELTLRYRGLVESVPAIFYIVDPEPPYRPQYVSTGGDLLGYTLREWVGHPSLWLAILHPEDREWVLAATNRAMAADEATDYEYRVIARDGSVRWFHDRGSFVRDATGRAVSWQGVMLEVTPRKEAEAALRDSEARYRLLFQESPLPMWVYDAETKAFLAVNEAAIAHYGYSRAEFLGMSAQDVIAVDASVASTDPRPSTTRTVRHRQRDGTLITVQVTSRDTVLAGKPACLVLAQDVTAHETLQAQLRQAQKLESIGRLAGGIAHDFNNLLTVISCYGESLFDALPEDGSEREDVREILAAAKRAASLTRQLLAFGRKQMLSPRLVCLADIVRNVEPMLRRLIGEDVKIVTALPPDSGVVRVDVAQIEQVLLNLAVNARDAMPNGGVLTIEVTNLDLDVVQDWSDAPEPGRYVRLAVNDTGSGMDAATLDRVFEPFFTTKEVGKGTGLGLATVYGIVKQSGGHVRAQSKPGCGSTFEALFPRCSATSTTSETAPATRAARRGHGTLLLVEDEDKVRHVTARSLRSLGYVVLEARHGLEALEIARTSSAIDLVVTDVVMPELGGLALAERLTTYIKPLRILFMSGYTNDATMLAGTLPRSASFLQKPFAHEDLARAVGVALGGQEEAQVA